MNRADMFNRSNAPVEPSADMRAVARSNRELYVALVAEGFTPVQAMQIIGVVLAASFQAGGGSDG